MLKARKMQEIVDQIVGSQIQIAALQEIRWRGYGLLTKDKYSIYYSCNPNTRGQAGTGFVIKNWQRIKYWVSNQFLIIYVN